jgi:hypothetical protein
MHLHSLAATVSMASVTFCDDREELPHDPRSGDPTMSALTVIIGPEGVSCPHCHETAPMSGCAQFLIGHAPCNPAPALWRRVNPGPPHDRARRRPTAPRPPFDSLPAVVDVVPLGGRRRP